MSAQLRELSERWFQAWLQKDAATVGRLAADDYLYVGPDGAALDRDAIVSRAWASDPACLVSGRLAG